jgi:hypothetical protein
MISVLKVRDAEINSALHRFTITKKGIVIDADSGTAEEILAQAARQGVIYGPVTTPGSGFDSGG